MEHSAAHVLDYSGDAASFNLAGWKRALATVSSILLAIIFVAAGCVKIAAPFEAGQFMAQMQVWSRVSLPFAVLWGIAEVVGGILILVPRFRKWGAWLLGIMLILMMGWVGMHYSTLVGKDCTCFPIVKRAVNPAFFAEDGAMLLMAIAAAAWSRRPAGLRPVMVILGAVAVFAGVSYGVNLTSHSGVKAPDSITVDGKPYSLQSGHIFLFFYDPECSHCDAAARRMAKLNWKDTQVVGIPVVEPQFAASFLHDTHLKAGTSNDLQQLRQVFKFLDPPFGVALVNGREKASITNWDDSEPAKTLRQIGFVQ